MALKLYNRFDDNYQSNDAFNSLRVTDENEKEWYPDSGASAHVTSSSSNLQDVYPYDGDDVVMVGDGVYLPITHTGSATITSALGTISLTDVLVCPDKTLLYDSKLCDDQHCGGYSLMLITYISLILTS